MNTDYSKKQNGDNKISINNKLAHKEDKLALQ
jgi:hypothetical protein